MLKPLDTTGVQAMWSQTKALVNSSGGGGNRG